MSYGIRISDEINKAVSVDLPDILSEINNGGRFHWSILFLEATSHVGEGKLFPEKSLPEFENKVFDSKNGFFLSWEELNVLAKKFFQIKDITLLGCIDKDLIKRYETDEEMYETCDFVIEMFDYSYWDVYSKDKSLIVRLAKKFKDVEWITKNE